MSDLIIQQAKLKIVDALLEFACGAFSLGVHAALDWLSDYVRSEYNVQHFYQEGDPNMTDPEIYRQRQIRSSDEEYYVNADLRGKIITGIRVVPARRGLHTPEVDNIDGGVNDNKVVLKLVPNSSGPWGFTVMIYGIPAVESMQIIM